MRLREWISAGSGICAVGVAILAVGSAPRWAQAAVAVLVAITVLPYAWSRRVPARIPPLLVLLGIATGMTMLQLVPVGDAIVGWLNPAGAALRADGAELASIAPSHTLTFDVPGSLSALAFFLTLLGVAAIALRISATERGRFALLAVVAGFCGLTALIVGLHFVLGARALYGIYEPLHVAPRLLGPLLNMNQLGCLMALGSVVAGGLVMYRRQPAKVRVAWLVVAVGCAVVSLSTLSRGAAIALACGGIVLAATLIGQRVAGDSERGRRGSFATGSLPIGIVAVCAVVVVLYASSGGVARQLESTSFNEVESPRSKFAAWRSAEILIEESPWIGWGRGSFEPAFTRVHAASGLATFSYLENEYLQTVVDWGIPGAILLGIAGGWLAFAAMRRWRSGPLAASGLAGITVVALQSNVDFGVELLGLAVPATILAATLTYVPLREPERRVLALARGMRVVHALAVVMAAAVLMSTATTSVTEDHDAIHDSGSVAMDDLKESLERHPLDYRGYLLQAVVLSRNRDARAIRVLNHALVLHPTHSGLHLFAGDILRERGNFEQAAVEYASALRSTMNVPRLLAQILDRMPNARNAALSIPPDDPRFQLILHTLEELHRPDIAIEWLQRVLVQRTDHLRTCAALYSMATRTRDVDVIAIASQKCPQYRPTKQVTLALAKTALQKHDDNAVIAMLSDVETWTGSIDDKRNAWLMLCDAHTHLGRFDEAERCLHRLDATGYVSDRSLIKKRLDENRHARSSGEPTPPKR